MAFRNLPEMPCGPILELHGQRKRFHVPNGLKRLLEDMTREVLRTQPENIYDFLAKFMEGRGQARRTEDAKRKTRKSWQVHRWSWQGKSVLEPEELKEMLSSFAAPPEETEKKAIVIQAAFRGYQARKKVNEIRKSLAGGRLSVQVDKYRTSKDSGEKSDGKRKTLIEEEARSDSNGEQPKDRTKSVLTLEDITPEDERKVVVIQSAIRGHLARKKVKEEKERRKSQMNMNQEEEQTEEPSPDVDATSHDVSEPPDDTTATAPAATAPPEDAAEEEETQAPPQTEEDVQK